MKKKPLILVTNDDGVSAPGVRAVFEALKEVGYPVMVAPERDNSAVSHSLTMTRPLKVKQLFEDIFTLMPFENKLVVVELSGPMVQQLFDYLASRKQAHPISGMKISLNKDELTAIEIQGKKFDITKNYWVLTHDYLQHGGDNMSFFTDPLSLYVAEYKVRDALIENLKQVDTLTGALDNRFSQIK